MEAASFEQWKSAERPLIADMQLASARAAFHHRLYAERFEDVDTLFAGIVAINKSANNDITSSRFVMGAVEDALGWAESALHECLVDMTSKVHSHGGVSALVESMRSRSHMEPVVN